MPKLHVVEPGSDEAKTRLAEAKRERRDLDKRYKRDARDLDRRIARLQASATSNRRRRPLTAAGQAGKGNLRAAREAFKKLGTATQAQVGQESGVRTGSLTWACRALLESGEIEETGNSVRGSREFRYTGAAPGRRVRRPGT